MKNKVCNECGVEIITYGNECPICKSFNVALKEEVKEEVAVNENEEK